MNFQNFFKETRDTELWTAIGLCVTSLCITYQAKTNKTNQKVKLSQLQ